MGCQGDGTQTRNRQTHFSPFTTQVTLRCLGIRRPNFPLKKSLESGQNPRDIYSAVIMEMPMIFYQNRETTSNVFVFAGLNASGSLWYLQLTPASHCEGSAHSAVRVHLRTHRGPDKPLLNELPWEVQSGMESTSKVTTGNLCSSFQRDHVTQQPSHNKGTAQ